MRLRRSLAAVGAVAAAFVGLARPAWAGGEAVREFEAAIVVAGDGTITVTETITYDYANSPDRHGIFRNIPVRFRFDDRYDRVTPIDRISVEGGSPSTPDGLQVSDSGSDKVLRIGDPDRTVSGVHRYAITYRVRGALNSFDDHEELFWNVTGSGWNVPIDRVRATVVAPTGVTRVACFAGPVGSGLACDASEAAGTEARFAHGTLWPGSGLTVVVALPKGSVAVPAPILDERWSLSRAFSVTPVTVGLAGVLTALVVFGLGRYAWASGRDRRWRGSVVDAAFGNDDGEVEAVPLSPWRGPEDPVEFVPPEGILPGQVGTLVDEVANPLDVTATIVHLAVRGYLRIEEIPKTWFLGSPDWKLHKLNGSGGLQPYERMLFDGLFKSGDEVELSDLKRTFAARLTKVQNALYDDMVKQGWFAARPDRVRSRWIVIGVLAFVAAVVVTILLAATTHLALLGVPFLVGAVMVLALSQKMPRRTPKGTGMVRRVFGFRRFITESEAERARFAERAHLFSEYLPYAIVFGVTDKWARAFEGLEAQASEATSWYVSSEPFSMSRFSSSMGSFAVTTAGTLSAVASTASSGGSGFSSGGGFSGGGFGGGGGGSW